MIKFPNMIKLLVVLAMVCSLVAIVAVPASAQTAVLSPASGPTGQAVTIQASGYLQGQVLTAKFDGSAMSTSPAVVTVPAGGALNFPVSIPGNNCGASNT